jgi:hypothetical protein
MSLCSRVLKGAALAAVVLVPAVAFAADSDGVAGTVVAVTVNESSADDYAVERGNIIVSEGAVTRKYQWGGTACSGRLVSEANVTLLVDAMKNPDRLQVVPSYKPGANLARCLVGLKLVALSPSVAR